MFLNPWTVKPLKQFHKRRHRLEARKYDHTFTCTHTKHCKCSIPNFPMWTYTIVSSTKVLIYLIGTNQLGSP